MLPTDLVHGHISKKRLLTPLNLEPPRNNPEVEEFVLDEIIKLVEAAEHDIVILVDACAVRRAQIHGEDDPRVQGTRREVTQPARAIVEAGEVLKSVQSATTMRCVLTLLYTTRHAHRTLPRALYSARRCCAPLLPMREC